MSPPKILPTLLLDVLQTDAALRHFGAALGIPDIPRVLPGPGASLQALGYGLASALEQRRCVDLALFTALVRAAPQHRDQIARSAEALLGPAASRALLEHCPAPSEVEATLFNDKTAREWRFAVTADATIRQLIGLFRREFDQHDWSVGAFALKGSQFRVDLYRSATSPTPLSYDTALYTLSPGTGRHISLNICWSLSFRGDDLICR